MDDPTGPQMSISEVCQVWSDHTKNTCQALRERGIDTDDIRSLLVTRLERALKVTMDTNNNINLGGNEKRSQVTLIISIKKYLGVTHKYKTQKKSEISDLGGGWVRRAENF